MRGKPRVAPAPKLLRVEERWKRALAGRVPQKTVSVVLQQMAVMLDSGVAMAEVFEALAHQHEHPVLEDVLNDLIRKVSLGGWKLAAAMAQHPEVFPPYVIMLVRAGEQGGDLSGRLRRAGEVMERNCDLVSQVKSALTGPAITLSFSGLVLFLVVKFIMPKFLDLYTEMKMELPTISRWVIGFVNLVNHPAFLLLVVLLCLLAARFRKQVAEKLFVMALHTPRLREWVGVFLCAQLCEILSSLIKEGVPILQALRMIADSHPREYHRRHLHMACDHLRNEGHLSESFAKIPYFPVMFVSVCVVSEEAGSLDDMLASLNRLLEQQVEMVIDTVLNLLEPLIISLLGLFMAVLFVGMFLPVYGLLAKLGP